MKGKGFNQLVKKGDKVKAGQELLDFNIDEIKKAGYDPTVIMIVTNPKDFLEVLTVLKDKDDNFNSKYTKDGLHPNDDGYEVITKELKKYLDK